MIVEKRNSIILLFILYSANVLSFNVVHKQCVVDTLLSNRVEIKLPNRYKKKSFTYEEGKFIDYFFLDGARITIFQGSLHGIPLLSKEDGYYSQKTDTVSNRITNRGEINDKAWREDKIDGIRIYYDKVPFDRVVLYDSILDSIHVLPYLNRKP